MCGDPAVCVVLLNEGCAAVPTPGRQALCMQHLISIEPVDVMVMEEDLTVDGLEAVLRR
jgi:hypothetical protein